ncbi:MAG: nitrogenase iron-molybdenum cofactor biosynthesis protein NifN [Hydrogenothermaceae bacterium]|nr:nitrogenase iron-molybdenum cofactor biosynthesis protein NifN [Hydrogenothermaceae bacterium]
MKNATVYPLKLSQPLGGALASLGIKGAIPIYHGPQGCTSFSVAFLTRHFRELIPIQTTALSEIATIIGDDFNLHEGIKNVINSRNPDIIIILSTGVSEVRGDDIEGGLKRFKEQYPEYSHIHIIFVSTPDFKGSLEDGFIAVLNKIIEEIPEAGEKIKNQVNVIVSPFLTAGDIDEIREIITYFGFYPIILPDLSETMSGSIDRFTLIPEGGPAIEDIRKMGRSEFTIAIGYGAKKPAQKLYDRFGIPVYEFYSLTEIESIDNFLKLLSQLSGKDVPRKYIKQRKQLIDLMLDSHFYFTDKFISIALEPSHTLNIYKFIKENLGINIETVVLPSKSEVSRYIKAENMVIGDLEDLKNSISKSVVLFSNSHGYHVVKEKDLYLIKVGIPIFDEFGHFLKTYISYKGAINILSELATIFFHYDEDKSYEKFLIHSHQF